MDENPYASPAAISVPRPRRKRGGVLLRTLGSLLGAAICGVAVINGVLISEMTGSDRIGELFCIISAVALSVALVAMVRILGSTTRRRS